MTYRPRPDDPLRFHFAWPLERRALVDPGVRRAATRERRAMGRALEECAQVLEDFATRLSRLDPSRPAETGALPATCNSLCGEALDRLSAKPRDIDALLGRPAPSGHGLPARLEKPLSLRDALDARRWSDIAADRARAAEIAEGISEALRGSTRICRGATISQVADRLLDAAALARDLPLAEIARSAA